MKEKIVKIMEEIMEDGYNETVDVIPDFKFNEVAQKIIELFYISNNMSDTGLLLSPEMKSFGMWILNISNSVAVKGRRHKMMKKEEAEDLVEFLYKDFKKNNVIKTRIEKKFTINGIIEVIEGAYSGKFFVIDEIDYSPKSILNDLITFKCSSLNGNISDFKFDNRCSIQIGILTIRSIKQNQ